MNNKRKQFDRHEVHENNKRFKTDNICVMNGLENDSMKIIAVRQNLKVKKFITSKEDLTRIKLSRNNIEKWCHCPFFSKVAIGCYVKIGIGRNSSSSVYKIGKIIEIVETNKIYDLGSTRTNKAFKLKHGKDVRVYRLEFISNQAFDDTEFKIWKDVLAKNNILLPTFDDLETKETDIMYASLYRYTDDDIDYIVNEKNKFAITDKKEKIAITKVELIKEKELAKLLDDHKLVSKIDAEIAKLDERQNIIEKNRVGKFAIFSQINQRNKQNTSGTIIQTLESNKSKENDTFARRKCLPTLISRSKAAFKQTNEEMEFKSQVINNTSIPINDLSIAKKCDLYAAHDFDIDINIPDFKNENQLQLLISGSSKPFPYILRPYDSSKN